MVSVCGGKQGDSRPSLLRRILSLTHPEDRDETRHTLYVIVCQDLNIGREECLMEVILARGDKTMLYFEIAELVHRCPSALLHELYSMNRHSLSYSRSVIEKLRAAAPVVVAAAPVVVPDTLPSEELQDYEEELKAAAGGGKKEPLKTLRRPLEDP